MREKLSEYYLFPAQMREGIKDGSQDRFKQGKFRIQSYTSKLQILFSASIIELEQTIISQLIIRLKLNGTLHFNINLGSKVSLDPTK